jgi:hypothetical protein
MVGKDRARIGVKIRKLMKSRIDLEPEAADFLTVSSGAEQGIRYLLIKC